MNKGSKTVQGKAARAGKEKMSTEKAKSKTSTKWEIRKKALEEAKKTSKSYEILTNTAELVNKISKHADLKVGEVVDEAVRLLATKYDIETDQQKRISLFSVNNDCEQLKSMFISLVKGYFNNDPGENKTRQIVKYIQQGIKDGDDVRTESSYEIAMRKFGDCCNYDEYCSLVYAVEIKSTHR